MTLVVENYAKTIKDFSLFFCDCHVKFFETYNTLLEMCFQVYYKPPRFLKFKLVKPKENCCCLAIVEQVGQKNRNGKTTMVFFPLCFYECIEGKSCICLVLAISIGDDWMVDLMIIYIEKTIAKALDINDIIKFFTGMSTR